MSLSDKPKSASSVIDVHVSDYYQVGDGQIYDKHYFIIAVKVENTSYSVDRSYVDFVDLDKRLRKRFPRSNILALPLDAISSIEKALSKEKSDRRKSGNSSNWDRDSLIGDNTNSSHSLRVREKYNENIASKTKALDTYLIELLTHPEVVSSDDLMLFLDEEASSMAIDPNSLAPLSVHDLLLISEPIHRVTVRRLEEHTFFINPGQFILWRFSTLDYDIGFSVELNGEARLGYARYKSHEKPICGVLEASAKSSGKLIWDNSYAKLRSKQLFWAARVVSSEDYHTAKAQALEIQREKKKFEDQRHALRRCAVNHATLLSGVIQNSSVVSEHAQEEKRRVLDLEDEVLKLQREIEEFQLDFDNAQIEYDEMERAKLTAEEEREHIEASWKYTMMELDLVQKEKEDWKKKLEEMRTKCQRIEEEKNQLMESSSKLSERLKESLRQNNEIRESCHAALEASDVEVRSIQERLDELTRTVQIRIQEGLMEARSEVAAFQKMNNEDQQKILVLEETIIGLQSKLAGSESHVELLKGKLEESRNIQSVVTPRSPAPNGVLGSSMTPSTTPRKQEDVHGNAASDSSTAAASLTTSTATTPAAATSSLSSTERSEYEEDIAQMQRHLTTLSIKHSISEERVVELTRENAELKEQLAALNLEDIHRQQQAFLELRAKNEHLQLQLTSHNGYIEKMQMALIDLMAPMNRLMSLATNDELPDLTTMNSPPPTTSSQKARTSSSTSNLSSSSAPSTTQSSVVATKPSSSSTLSTSVKSRDQTPSVTSTDLSNSPVLSTSAAISTTSTPTSTTSTSIATSSSASSTSSTVPVNINSNNMTSAKTATNNKVPFASPSMAEKSSSSSGASTPTSSYSFWSKSSKPSPSTASNVSGPTQTSTLPLTPSELNSPSKSSGKITSSIFRRNKSKDSGSNTPVSLSSTLLAEPHQPPTTTSTTNGTPSSSSNASTMASSNTLSSSSTKPLRLTPNMGGITSRLPSTPMTSSTTAESSDATRRNVTMSDFD